MSNAREYLLQVKVSMRERAILKALADYEDMNWSEVVRYLVRREAHQRGLDAVVVEDEEKEVVV